MGRHLTRFFHLTNMSTAANVVVNVMKMSYITVKFVNVIVVKIAWFIVDRVKIGSVKNVRILSSVLDVLSIFALMMNV